MILLALALVLQDNGTGGPGERWRNIDRTPGFSRWRHVMQKHVDVEATRRINHLCAIVGVDGRPDQPIAYLYWPEQHRIERLSARDDPAMPDDLSEMLFQLGPIRLDHDVIDPARHVNLNPNAVTRSWVNRLIARCRRRGTDITLIKGRGR